MIPLTEIVPSTTASNVPMMTAVNVSTTAQDVGARPWIRQQIPTRSVVNAFSWTFKAARRAPTNRRVWLHSSSALETRSSQRTACAAGAHPIDALIFDCDGVIVESEDIHRRAYNATFEHFKVVSPGGRAPVDWTEEFYDALQNKVGGGKPKMRWYFGENGWPTSSVLDGKAPETDDEKTLLIDTLQDWKTDKYKDIIGSGQVQARAGVVELMDTARTAGVPVAVCSAATKAAVVFVLESLLGKQRFESLDLFMAGDDVPVKKPDPTIYKIAAERLVVDPARCLVIEDSVIGLQAALGAGMKCIITYTNSTANQQFGGAAAILESLEGVEFAELTNGDVDGRDDRAATASLAAARRD